MEQILTTLILSCSNIAGLQAGTEIYQNQTIANRRAECIHRVIKCFHDTDILMKLNNHSAMEQVVKCSKEVYL